MKFPPIVNPFSILNPRRRLSIAMVVYPVGTYIITCSPSSFDNSGPLQQLEASSSIPEGVGSIKETLLRVALCMGQPQ